LTAGRLRLAACAGEGLPTFPSDVKARQDKMVGLVETMLKRRRQLTAHGLRLTAYGQDEVEIRVGEGAADG
jgi:hypothetical protein